MGKFPGKKKWRSQKWIFVSKRLKTIQISKNLLVLGEWLVKSKVTAYVALCKWCVKREKHVTIQGKSERVGKPSPPAWPQVLCTRSPARPSSVSAPDTASHLEKAELPGSLPTSLLGHSLSQELLKGRPSSTPRTGPRKTGERDSFSTKSGRVPTQGALRDHSRHTARARALRLVWPRRGLWLVLSPGDTNEKHGINVSHFCQDATCSLVCCLGQGRGKFKRLPRVLHQKPRKQHDVLPATKHLPSSDPFRDLESGPWVELWSLRTLCEINLSQDSVYFLDPLCPTPNRWKVITMLCVSGLDVN